MQHFWDEFIGHAFDKSHVPYALSLPSVLDWKEFLQPCLREISGHSVPRSFRICIQNRVPVLFYKDCCLDTNWKGFHADFGIQLMHSMPTGIPSVVPPTPVPQDQLSDLHLFYDHMSNMAKQEWLSFMQNQFAKHAFDDTTCYDDFCLQELDLPSGFHFEPVFLLQHFASNILVQNHPFVSVQQFKLGDVIAFHHLDAYAIGYVCDATENQLTVFCYKKKRNTWLFERPEDNYLVLSIFDVILADVQFTATHTIKAKCMRKINQAVEDKQKGLTINSVL